MAPSSWSTVNSVPAGYAPSTSGGSCTVPSPATTAKSSPPRPSAPTRPSRIVTRHPFGPGRAALRQADVAVQVGIGEQVAGRALQHHPDLGTAYPGDLRVGELVHVVRADVHPAGGRPHEPGEQRHERRLAR